AGIIQLLHGNLMLDVALGALVGLIPGCGPQIVVATLFVTGNLPFAAVLANTISQHGDAIFPLLSSARRTAWRLSLTGGALGAAAGLLWAVAFR
ncbi:MAG: putative manganese transporter, partial [Sulfobacillus sp.]